jgi:predicted MPP superfamily phosphohydrolase
MLGINPGLAFFFGLVGNCGFWLFCFNRVNAFGYPRPLAKIAEKLCIFCCFAIPSAVIVADWEIVAAWLTGFHFWPEKSMSLLGGWLAWNLSSLCLLAPLWIESRLWLIPPSRLLHTEGECFNVHRLVSGGSAAHWKTRLWSQVPLNEWAHLEVTQKLLHLPRYLPAAEGMTIGHLSDLHFTGQYTEGHYHFVVDRLLEKSPDMIIVSGDLLDFQHCLETAERVLSRLTAPLGICFVLGNHEQRLRDINPMLETLNALGWVDLGSRNHCLQRGALSIRLIGNESPWFFRHQCNPRHGKQTENQHINQQIVAPVESQNSSTLIMAVAHSPDCIQWARSNRCDLMLAGHTHGGQARFPGIGPIVAPSLYGSKFASGLFFLEPTLMHVSRGVAGTHTIRWRCPPEITVLKLTNEKIKPA